MTELDPQIHRESPSAISPQPLANVRGSLSDSAPKSTIPTVFDYQDYRKFLSSWFEARKKFQTGYSSVVFAKKAGLGSHAFLGMVMRGERNLSHQSVRQFQKALGLKGREAIYFEKLVYFSQAKNSDDKAHYFEQLTSLSDGKEHKFLIRMKQHADYIKHWYVLVLRQLVGLEDFQADPEWMAHKLQNKITKKQAQEAWETLLSLKIVELDQKTGKHFLPDYNIDIDPGSVDFAIRNFHKEFLDRTKDAVDGQPLDERELSSVSMTLPEQDIPLLRERLKEIRKKLAQEFPTQKVNRTKVVAVNMQMLVLTTDEPFKPKKEKNEKERERRK